MLRYLLMNVLKKLVDPPEFLIDPPRPILIHQHLYWSPKHYIDPLSSILIPQLLLEFPQTPLAPSNLNQIGWDIYHWKGKIQIYKMVQPDLSFCCWLFVKSSYTSLESKNSDLQDGMIRFVAMLLLVWKFKIYIIRNHFWRLKFNVVKMVQDLLPQAICSETFPLQWSCM